MVRAMALVEIDTSTRHRRSLIVGYFRSVIPSHNHSRFFCGKKKTIPFTFFPPF